MTDLDRPAPRNQAQPQTARRTQMTVRPTGAILPPSNIQGNALMVVIAIMAFLACLTLGAVSMVRATAAGWQSQISREITIQIKPEDGLDMDQALVKARDLALTFVGTKEGQIMDDAATARLLEPWLGQGLDLSELPVPRLVIITIDEANPPDFAAMRELLKAQVPQAFLDDHRTWVDRLVQMARTTVLIGSGVLVLVFTAMVLTVVFATRGALSGNRHIIEVLHFVGAEGLLRRAGIPEALPEDQPQGRCRRRSLGGGPVCARRLLAEPLARDPGERPGRGPVRDLLDRLSRLSRHLRDHDRDRASDHADGTADGHPHHIRDRPDPLRPRPLRRTAGRLTGRMPVECHKAACSAWNKRAMHET